MQPSTEPEPRIKILLELGRFSDNTADALIKHFVEGKGIDTCCWENDIAQPNFQRSIKRLNEINHLVEQVKEIDLYHLSDVAGGLNKSITANTDKHA